MSTEKLRLTAVWPKMNKQEHIDGYLNQLRTGDIEHCSAEIEETICLTTDEWQDFINHLITERPWLAGKGGTIKPHLRSALLVVRPGATPEESIGILVDPQGYDYARYVGFYIGPNPEAKGLIVTNVPNLPGLADVMETTLNGVTFKDRVFAECSNYLETNG